MADVCPECGGKGIVEDIFGDEDICDVCDGDGRVSRKQRF